MCVCVTVTNARKCPCAMRHVPCCSKKSFCGIIYFPNVAQVQKCVDVTLRVPLTLLLSKFFLRVLVFSINIRMPRPKYSRLRSTGDNSRL